jgi:hypothetical protein
MLHEIFTGLALTVFGSAGATAIGVIASTVGPQWGRIWHLALGKVESNSTPLTTAPGR